MRGPNRTEFEKLVSDMVDYYMPRLPDQSQRDDLVASLTWYYSPWPHLDDRDLNRHQISMVWLRHFCFIRVAAMKTCYE
jgi:hypothetical protein